ncbi:MAG: hydrolase [Actinomycetota bacterium]
MVEKTAGCGCPEIRDEEWDLAEREWPSTAYYSKRLWMFFHIPIGQSNKIAKVRRELDDKGLAEADPSQVLVKDGLFVGAVLVAVTGEDVSGPGIKTIGPSKVVTKVSRGSKKDLKAAVSGLLSYTRSKLGAHPSAVYFWQVDCDRCREPGIDHVVVLAEI